LADAYFSRQLIPNRRNSS